MTERKTQPGSLDERLDDAGKKVLYAAREDGQVFLSAHGLRDRARSTLRAEYARFWATRDGCSDD